MQERQEHEHGNLRRGITAVLTGCSAALLVGAFTAHGFASIADVMAGGIVGAAAVASGWPR